MNTISTVGCHNTGEILGWLERVFMFYIQAFMSVSQNNYHRYTPTKFASKIRLINNYRYRAKNEKYLSCKSKIPTIEVTFFQNCQTTRSLLRGGTRPLKKARLTKTACFFLFKIISLLISFSLTGCVLKQSILLKYIAGVHPSHGKQVSF